MGGPPQRFPGVMKRSNGISRLATFMLVAAAFRSVAADAATIYVSPHDPAATNIAKIEGARPGDEVVVAPGTYRFRLYLEGLGTATQPIVIRAADPSRRPVWDLAGNITAKWPGTYMGG